MNKKMIDNSIVKMVVVFVLLLVFITSIHCNSKIYIPNYPTELFYNPPFKYPKDRRIDVIDHGCYPLVLNTEFKKHLINTTNWIDYSLEGYYEFYLGGGSIRKRVDMYKQWWAHPNLASIKIEWLKGLKFFHLHQASFLPELQIIEINDTDLEKLIWRDQSICENNQERTIFVDGIVSRKWQNFRIFKAMHNNIKHVNFKIFSSMLGLQVLDLTDNAILQPSNVLALNKLDRLYYFSMDHNLNTCAFIKETKNLFIHVLINTIHDCEVEAKAEHYRSGGATLSFNIILSFFVIQLII